MLATRHLAREQGDEGGTGLERKRTSPPAFPSPAPGPATLISRHLANVPRACCLGRTQEPGWDRLGALLSRATRQPLTLKEPIRIYPGDGRLRQTALSSRGRPMSRGVACYSS